MTHRRLPHALLAAAVVAALAAPVAAQDSTKSGVRKRTPYEDLQMFSQVLNHIRVNHADTVDSHELMMAAIRGMVAAADPHSYFITSVRLDAEKEKALRSKKLFPVPIGWAFVEGSPIVVAAAPGSAAAKLDILPGDELIAVDGKPVQADNELELSVLLAGAKGSSVQLRFYRQRTDGSVIILERDVRRERPDDVTNVPVAFKLDDITGYVRITGFDNEKVADDLHAALGRLEGAKISQLVLDLRDNGGGIVTEAANVAGEFLPRGRIVYTTQGRKTEMNDTGRVSRSFWSAERRYPIVVLVNQGTASAAELVAGALQDHDRALIVGQPSFGKALVMRGFPLTDGSTLVMVVGHGRTPCGRIIQRQYFGVSKRAYYRLAAAERDTAGRPSCKTAGGRTVYGGGGIVPDAMLPRPDRPSWLSRANESTALLKWIGAHATEQAASYPTLDALLRTRAPATGAVASLRTFAEREGIRIPPGAEADSLLAGLIVRRVADAKWGDEGYYRVVAVTDPDVARAVALMPRARELTGK